MKWHGAIGRIVQFLIFAFLAALASARLSLAAEPSWVHSHCSPTSCSGSFSSNTRRVSKGSHTVSGKAYDCNGNVGVTASVTVYK